MKDKDATQQSSRAKLIWVVLLGTYLVGMYLLQEIGATNPFPVLLLIVVITVATVTSLYMARGGRTAFEICWRSFIVTLVVALLYSFTAKEAIPGYGVSMISFLYFFPGTLLILMLLFVKKSK